MKIKKEIIRAFMNKYHISAQTLAEEIHVDLAEIEKLLDGKSVDENTARKFIYYFGVDEVMDAIDWEAMGKKRPNL